MATMTSTEALPNYVSPDGTGSSDISLSKRRKLMVASPTTPTPARKTSHQHRAAKATVKPRAASTGSLAIQAAGSSTRSARKDRSISPSASSPRVEENDEEEPHRHEAASTQSPCTPPNISTIRPAHHSSPAVVTRSALNRRREMSEPTTNDKADQMLAQELRAGPGGRLFDDGKVGLNYVLSMSHHSDPCVRFIKIGETVYSGEKRKQQISSKCGHFGHNETIPGQVPGRFRKKAEKLILAELSPHRYKLDCVCRKSHRECVDAPVRLAVDVTQRWTQFCESEPWDNKGKLLDFWEKRLGDLQAGGSLDKATSDERARLWATFASPGCRAFDWYNLKLCGPPFKEQYALWMVMLLALFLNIVLVPTQCAMYFNSGLQLWILMLYTFRDVHFAHNNARKRGKTTLALEDSMSSSISTPEPPRHSSVETEADVGAQEEVECEGSSHQNPIDLTSDDGT